MITLGTMLQGIDCQTLSMMEKERGNYLTSIQATLGKLIKYIKIKTIIFRWNQPLKWTIMMIPIVLDNIFDQ